MSSSRSRKYGYGIFSAAFRSRPVKLDFSHRSITLVIGFAPRKVARALFGGSRDEQAPELPNIVPLALLGATWRYLSLLGARSTLVVTRAALDGVRATLPVIVARECRGCDRKRQVVTHRRQPASVCTRSCRARHSFGRHQNCSVLASDLRPELGRGWRAQRLRLIRPLSPVPQIVRSSATVGCPGNSVVS
jgi:hypothetical protein